MLTASITKAETLCAPAMPEPLETLMKFAVRRKGLVHQGLVGHMQCARIMAACAKLVIKEINRLDALMLTSATSLRLELDPVEVNLLKLYFKDEQVLTKMSQF